LSDPFTRFRWPLVRLIARSSMASYRAPRDLPSPLPGVAQALTLAAGSDAGNETFGESPAGNVLADPAECGDTHPSDCPREMDKIFSLFSPRRGAGAARWSGVHSTSLPSDPMFPFDRPPKMALRQAGTVGCPRRGTVVFRSTGSFQPAAPSRLAGKLRNVME
jgi:hypothetical protein